jgi:hypothetical protein
VPELKGTTEEKGEYGRASSSVSGRELVWPAPFNIEAPFEPFTIGLWAPYPLFAIVCEIVRD